MGYPYYCEKYIVIVIALFVQEFVLDYMRSILFWQCVTVCEV